VGGQILKYLGKQDESATAQKIRLPFLKRVIAGAKTGDTEAGTWTHSPMFASRRRLVIIMSSQDMSSHAHVLLVFTASTHPCLYRDVVMSSTCLHPVTS
jgi:hypothetical protein